MQWQSFYYQLHFTLKLLCCRKPTPGITNRVSRDPTFPPPQLLKLAQNAVRNHDCFLNGRKGFSDNINLTIVLDQ